MPKCCDKLCYAPAPYVCTFLAFLLIGYHTAAFRQLSGIFLLCQTFLMSVHQLEPRNWGLCSNELQGFCPWPRIALPYIENPRILMGESWSESANTPIPFRVNNSKQN